MGSACPQMRSQQAAERDRGHRTWAWPVGHLLHVPPTSCSDSRRRQQKWTLSLRVLHRNKAWCQGTAKRLTRKFQLR